MVRRQILTASRNVNPGGWVEFQDMEMTMRSDDGTLTDKSPVLEFTRILMQAHDTAGVEVCPLLAS